MGPKPEAVAPLSVPEGQLKLQLARGLLVEVGKQFERGRGLGRGFGLMAREQEDASQGEDEPCPGKDEQSEERSFHVASTSRFEWSSRNHHDAMPLCRRSPAID